MARSRLFPALQRGRSIAPAVSSLLLLAVFLAFPSAVPGAEKDDDFESIFQSAPRDITRKLSRARFLIEESRYGEAVRLLGEILEQPKDYFYRSDSTSRDFHSLKAEAERMIGEMPSKGRDLYELQFGAQSQKLLNEALIAGDISLLAETSRRFFHTQAGYQAAFLLGLHHFDHGQPLAGASILQRLLNVNPPLKEMQPGLSLTLASCWLHAGMTDKARNLLIKLKQSDPELRITVAGKDIPLFDDDSKAIEWLTRLIGTKAGFESFVPLNWLLFQGNASRTASTTGSVPLLILRWRRPLSDDPLIESWLACIRKQSKKNQFPAIPVFHPLAVDNYVLMRSLHNLQAVDFTTGKILWEVPVDGREDLSPGKTTPQLVNNIGNPAGRMWEDLTFGTLSSDGVNVYSIEDDESTNSPFRRNFAAFQRARRVVFQIGQSDNMLSNRLAAHDIRTGKLVWELGGPDGPDALPQPETFFLGAPLPLQGKLYVLAETAKAEVRLMALDPADGDLLWSRQISLVVKPIATSPDRCLMGVSPSYADGVLVCPTSTGAVVGVELATKSLLWGYCYASGGNRRNSSNTLRVSRSTINKWMDNGVSIVNGRVFVTPVDSQSLYCLNLHDGELLWSDSRKNDLYLACVTDDKAVLVGTSSVRALRIEDGKPAWDGRHVVLPEGSMPSGRGFLNGNRYYLPLSTAQVAVVDLVEGKIERLTKSRTGDLPGNLICHKDRIISHGIEGVDLFFQLDLVDADVKRRLATDPEDAQAISLRGELFLNSDRLEEAVEAFRRAYGIAPDPHTRKLLRESLLDGLQNNYSTYRKYIPEIEPLLDNIYQQATLLRLTASGLRGAGQWADALKKYLDLADLEPNQNPLDQIDSGLLVRRDRWIRLQLADLLRDSKGEMKEMIDEIVSLRMKQALKADSIKSLRRFLDYFGGLPITSAARDELLKRLKESGNLAALELLSDAADKPVERETPEATVSWPTGNVESTTEKTKNQFAGIIRMKQVLIQGDPGPYFRGVTFKYDYRSREITAIDRTGKEAWKVALMSDDGKIKPPTSNTNVYARALGHLLLVSVGWDVYAIDSLNPEPLEPSASKPKITSDETPRARLLWGIDMENPVLESSDSRGKLTVPLPIAARNAQFQQFNRSQNPSNLLGPVSRAYVCLQRMQNIVAVDPLDGDILWVRQDLPDACNVFGDEEHLFVLSLDKEDATLLRADDGAKMGDRKIPRQAYRRGLPNGKTQTYYNNLGNTCLAVFGRKLLLWWPEGRERELALIDPLEGRDEWPRRKFAHTSKTFVLDDEAVGVVEPDGHFELISLPDGRTLIDTKLEALPKLIDIALFKSGDRYFLLTNSRTTNPSVSIQRMPNQYYRTHQPIYDGLLYAFDENGKLLWPEPTQIENQYLIDDLPSTVPLVVFACQHYDQNPKKRGQDRWTAHVLCVDKRTGRKAYEGDFSGHNSVFDVACDPEKKTISLLLQRETVILTLTNNPIPPPTKKAEPAESTSGGKVTHALWNSLRRSIASDDESPLKE